MNCPHCNHDLTGAQIKRLWAQYTRSKAKSPTKQTATERAIKAAQARWRKENEK